MNCPWKDIDCSAKRPICDEEPCRHASDNKKIGYHTLDMNAWWVPDIIPDLPAIENEWKAQSRKNLQKWGIQTWDQLSSAIQEEAGELARATLEHEYEKEELDKIQEELDDLAALIYQYQLKIRFSKKMIKEHREESQ